MINLRKKDRVRIIEIAQKTLSANIQVWAYGSRVKGTNHEASDLDLVLVSSNEQQISADELLRFKTALQNSIIPIIVQVTSWETLPKSFQDNILLHYDVLYVVKYTENQPKECYR